MGLWARIKRLFTTNINAALDSVATGDSILVHAGTYSEAPNKFGLGELTILGIAGYENTTILLGGSYFSLIGDSLVVSGLTLQDGEGVHVVASQIEFTACRLQNLLAEVGSCVTLWPFEPDVYEAVCFEENVVQNQPVTG